MNIGDVRFNLYQTQNTSAGSSAGTGRGGYTTENVTEVEPVTPVRSATSSATSPMQPQPRSEEALRIANLSGETRGQVIDIIV